MAIFYNHIKGCGKYATNTFSGVFPEGVSEHQDVWSFIKFADILYVDKTDSTRLVTSVKNSPVIYLNAPNQPVKNITNECYSQDYEEPEQEADKLFTESNTFCLGHILTTNAKDQYINKSFYFKDNVQIKNELGVTKSLTISRSWKDETNTIDDTTCTVQLSGQATSIIGVDEQHDLAFTKGSVLWFFGSKTAPGQMSTRPHDGRGWGDYAAIYKQNDGTLIIESSKSGSKGSNFVRQPGYFAFSSITVDNNGDKNDTEFIVKGKCEALYFNATSDRRAKTNITPAEFSALRVVNSIPTYTFNYNNKEEKTIGLIAQEAAEFDLDGFNMVDNIEATGQDGDFMQMKESKLVYVLWKAVQELSAEVEDLKSQIRNLK